MCVYILPILRVFVRFCVCKMYSSLICRCESGVDAASYLQVSDLYILAFQNDCVLQKTLNVCLCFVNFLLCVCVCVFFFSFGDSLQIYKTKVFCFKNTHFKRLLCVCVCKINYHKSVCARVELTLPLSANL